MQHWTVNSVNFSNFLKIKTFGSWRHWQHWTKNLPGKSARCDGKIGSYGRGEGLSRAWDFNAGVDFSKLLNLPLLFEVVGGVVVANSAAVACALLWFVFYSFYCTWHNFSRRFKNLCRTRNWERNVEHKRTSELDPLLPQELWYFRPTVWCFFSTEHATASLKTWITTEAANSRRRSTNNWARYSYSHCFSFARLRRELCTLLTNW